MADEVARVADASRPADNPLNPFEQVQYKRLVYLGRVGTGLCSLAFYVMLATSSVFELFVWLVAIGITVTTAVRKIPYRQKLKEAGYVKLWFAKSNPTLAYENMGGPPLLYALTVRTDLRAD